ncbi:MAG: leucyl aminopeptidase [Actinomycetota bacterium]|nr:leucyl aminopeptidase [Actinomycetota bacterium]
MLRIIAAAEDPREVHADLLVVPVFKGGIEGPGAAAALEGLGLDRFPVTPDFRGDIGQHLLLISPDLACSGVLFVGLGRMDETDAERLRRAAGVAARAARDVQRVATTLAQVHASAAALEAVAEGFHLGAHEDRRFRSDQDEAPRLTEVVVLAPSSRLGQARRAIERAETYAHATSAARGLVNLPADRKRPADLATAITELASAACQVTVHDECDLARRGFGGLLAVGQGSGAPPRLVELRYRPAMPLGHVVLVGKGVTFDAGGLSLKSSERMGDAKSDMAGAAAVAGACSALDRLGVRLQVTGLLALAENMPGGDAQRPDDVVTVHGGTTVEVRDTSAAASLVLADVLHYATQLRPDALVDVATVGDWAVTALGRYAAAVMSNDQDLLDSLRRAAAVAGESLWPLPLWPDLNRSLDTPIADVSATVDGAGGGAIIAGLFLRRFVDETPWAHLDITGPAFLSPELARDYRGAGGSGFGVRTLLAWLEAAAPDAGHPEGSAASQMHPLQP